MPKAVILFCVIIFHILNQSFATKTVDEVQEEIESCIEDFESSQFNECPDDISSWNVTPYCDETNWYIWGRSWDRISESQKKACIENALKSANNYVHEFTKEEESSYAALNDKDKKTLAKLYQEMELEKAKIKERYFSLCEFKAYLDRKSEFDEDMANGRTYATIFTENVKFVNHALKPVNWDKLRAGIPQKYFTPLCHNSGDSDLDKAIALGRQIFILCELRDKKSVGNTDMGIMPHDIKGLVNEMKAYRATIGIPMERLYKTVVKHEKGEIHSHLEITSVSGKVKGDHFWNLLVAKLLADKEQEIRDLGVKVVAVYTDASKKSKIEHSPTEYDIPHEVHLDTTTGVKTIDMLMEAKIPVGPYARPNDIFRIFVEKANSYKIKVLKANGSSANVDESKLESTANMDKIVAKKD
ncbi:hypothetical protein Ddc_19308 [Ditylenchus destructor]|nr:hypothetical protein Ddc_19308 [Ditylenchus destructor]